MTPEHKSAFITASRGRNLKVTPCYECKGRCEVMVKQLVGFTNVTCHVCDGKGYIVKEEAK